MLGHREVKRCWDRLYGWQLKICVSLDHRWRDGRVLQRPAVLVNGIPKTGTTWVRRMLASLPGFRCVGSFGGEIGAYRKLQPGAVVHGHDPYREALKTVLKETGLKTVLLMRDPRDKLISRLFHVRRSPEHKRHGRLVEIMHLLRVATKEDALAATIVARNRFERLASGRKIWQQARSPGESGASSHFRKGIKGEWRNYLKEEHVDHFKANGGETLIAWGYASNMDWDASPA